MSGITKMGPIDGVSDGSAIPVLAFKVKDPAKFTVFHLSDQLRMGGWQVPAYTMPADVTDVAVLRIAEAVAHLEQYPPAWGVEPTLGSGPRTCCLRM